MCALRVRPSCVGIVCILALLDEVSAIRSTTRHNKSAPVIRSKTISPRCPKTDSSDVFKVSVDKALDLPKKSRFLKKDKDPTAYVKFSVTYADLGTRYEAHTGTFKESQNPEWNFECAFPATKGMDATVTMEVMQYDGMSRWSKKKKEKLIGKAYFTLPYGTEQVKQLQLEDSKGKMVDGELHLSASWGNLKGDLNDEPKFQTWHVIAAAILGSVCLLSAGFLAFGLLFYKQTPDAKEDPDANGDQYEQAYYQHDVGAENPAYPQRPVAGGWHQVVGDAAPTGFDAGLAAPPTTDDFGVAKGEQAVQFNMEQYAPSGGIQFNVEQYAPPGTGSAGASSALPANWQTILPPEPLGSNPGYAGAPPAWSK